jgi:cytochrome c
MKKFLSTTLLALSSFVFSTGASASGGTADEAMALVKKASTYLKANGKEKALAEFNNPKGQFVDRDLYIFVVDMTGTTLANGSNAKVVGKNMMEQKDQNDKYFIKEFIKLGNTAGKGWVDYRWINPVSQKMETKSTYIEKTEGLIIGSGIYK